MTAARLGAALLARVGTPALPLGQWLPASAALRAAVVVFPPPPACTAWLRRMSSAFPPHTGNLAKWYKKEGDEIAPGDVLADVETDKATMAFENQDDGFIAKLLVPEGAQNVQVGEVVAILVGDAADIPKFVNYTAGAASGSAPPSPAAAAAPVASASPPPGVSYKMLDMPALSPTMSTGNLVAWMVKPGDEIFPGQILAEIETDKATLPFENQEDGFIASLLVAAGTQGVAVGTPLAVVVGEAADMAKMAGWSPSPSQAASSSPTAAPPIPAASQPPPTDASWSSRIGPAAQIILAAAGINPSAIVGTGPKGIITKSDALQAAANPPKAVSPAPATDSKQAADVPLAKVPTPAKAPSPTKGPTSAPPDGAEYEDTPVTTMRRVIASRLLESKTTIPAIYMRMEVDLDQVTALRTTMKNQGSKVSVNDFVIRAAALALKDVPEVNCTWDEAAAAAVPSAHADVSVAVAIPGGLITPIVKAAETKTLAEISASVKDLAGRARENKLKPDEFVGGSFSVSNLGMFGTDAFYAIINPPQCCIMAVGGSRTKVVLGGDGAPKAKSVMDVSITADNRAVDELSAARFLEAFAGYFAEPVRMVM